MEIIKRKSAKYIGERILICLFLLLFIGTNRSAAQAADSASAQTTPASSDAPDAKNAFKVLEEAKKIQEQDKRDEIMSYIYMGLGFSVVIGIAWFTTSLAKKRRLKEDEARAQRAQMMQH